MYSLSLVEMHNFSILLCLSPPWRIRVKCREREEGVCRLLALQFKTYLWKGFLCPLYTFFLFHINFRLAAGTPFKISVVPGEIIELTVNYS